MDIAILSAIDVSSLSKLEHLVCGNIPNLTKIILKNNSLESNLYFSGCPKLSSICCDAGEVTTVQNLVNSYGYTNCEVSASCTTSTKITNASDTIKNIGVDLNNDIIRLSPNPSVNNIYVQSKASIELISL